MATDAKKPLIASPLLAVGDDVYAKPSDEPGSTYEFVAVPWAGDMVTGDPLLGAGGTSYFPEWFLSTGEMVYDVPYKVYKNVFSAAFTVDYGSDANKLSCSDILSTDAATRVLVRGSNLPSGLVQGKPYWAINVVDGVSLELEAIQGSGTPVDLGDNGSGSFTLTLASRRSSSDLRVGIATLDALNTTDGEGQADRNYAIQQAIQTAVNAILEDTGTSIPATLAAIQAKTDLVGSSAAALATTISSSSIQTQVGSTKSVTIACNTDVSAKTLVVTFETLRSKTDIATVADGSLTKSSNNATFALPAAATSSERTLRFTIKDTTTDEAYAAGLLFVSYDAKSD